MLLREIINVYSQTHVKYIQVTCDKMDVKAGVHIQTAVI